MPSQKQIRIDFFQPTASVAEFNSLGSLLADMSTNGRLDRKEFTTGNHHYLVDEIQWWAESKCLTGTLFQLRDDWPSRVAPDGVKQLTLQDDEDLGEPACFAILPHERLVACHYNHHGPRHTKIPFALTAMGHRPPFSLAPIIKSDALDRLQDANVVRKLVFTLHNAGQLTDASQAEPSVSRAIEVAADLGGVNVGIEVSMSTLPGSLDKSKITNLVTKLLERPEALGKLHLGLRDDEDSDAVILNLLQDREIEYIEVDYRGREIDRDDCQKKLRARLLWRTRKHGVPKP